MGYVKVVNKGNGKVVLVHQLGMNGEAYAEDVTIEVQAGVPESRVKYLADMDGKIGSLSYTFYPADIQPEGFKFPEV